MPKDYSEFLESLNDKDKKDIMTLARNYNIYKTEREVVTWSRFFIWNFDLGHPCSESHQPHFGCASGEIDAGFAQEDQLVKCWTEEIRIGSLLLLKIS